MNYAELFRTGSVSQADLAAAFDDSGAVRIEMLTGTWKVDPGYADTPGGRMLIEGGWWGARFHDAESVDPLLFPSPGGDGLFAADLLAVLALLGTGARDVSARRSQVEAAGPIGRVRMIEYRGVLTATLIYDQAPVLDYLRAVDPDTLVAAVEQRGMVTEPAYALLRRCPEPTPRGGKPDR